MKHGYFFPTVNDLIYFELKYVFYINKLNKTDIYISFCKFNKILLDFFK